jgi:hypothetical protein
LIDYHIENTLYGNEYVKIRYADWLKEIQNRISTNHEVYLGDDELSYINIPVSDNNKRIFDEQHFKINIHGADHTNIRYTDWLLYMICNGEHDDNILVHDIIDYYINNYLNDDNIIIDELNIIDNKLDCNDSVKIKYDNTANVDKTGNADDIIKLNENIRIYYE